MNMAAAEAEAAPTAAPAAPLSPPQVRPKSILVSKQKKVPKLVHAGTEAAGGPKLKIYTQSATEEEGTDTEASQRRAATVEAQVAAANLLQVPKRRDAQLQHQQQFMVPGQNTSS